MCTRFEENRRRLAALVHELPGFTEEEILREFARRNGGDVAIDVFQTVGQYLEELRSIGVLEREYGRYTVSATARVA